MTLRFTVLTFLLAFTLHSRAQQWKLHSPTPLSDNLKFSFVNKDTIWAAGTSNVVARSTDGGATWSLKHSPSLSSTLWYSVHFVQGDVGFLGGSGIINKTTDGGNSWKQFKLPFTANVHSIYFLNKDTGWCSVSGYLYKTTNSGESWTQAANLSISFITKIGFVTSDTGFIIVNGANVFRTVNGGNNWSFISLPSSGVQSNDFSFINKDTGWIATNQGLFVTYNSGVNWTLMPHPAVSGVVFLNKDTGFFASNQRLMATYDGGQTGVEIAGWQGGSIGRHNQHLFAASSSVMLHSPNRGVNWDTVFTATNIVPPASSILNGKFADASQGWIIGTNGFVARSADSAKTWSRQVSPSVKDLYAMYALSKDTAWIAGNSLIMRTYNAGTTWDSISNAGNKQVRAIWFMDKDTGFSVSENSPYSIMRTVNGGVTWSAMSGLASGALSDIYFISRDTGYVCGASGRAMKTVNGGLSWTSLGFANSNTFNKISFSGNTGMIFGNAGTAVTKNRGATWAIQTHATTVMDGIVITPTAAISSNSVTETIDKSANYAQTWHSTGSPNDAGYHLLYADTGFIIAAGSTKIVSALGNWTIAPELDSVSRTVFSNTDSLLFMAYGKNFDQHTLPVVLPNATATTRLISPAQLEVLYTRSTNFPAAYVQFNLTGHGQAAGRTQNIRLTVFDSFPLTPASGITCTFRDSARMNVSWNKGSGTSFIMIMRKGAPVNAFPSQDMSSYYSTNFFGSGSHLGDGNYAVAAGIGAPTNAVTIYYLEPNTTYYLAIFEYTRTSVPINYNTEVYATAAFRTSNVYYNKTSGALNQLSSWSNKMDGSGTPPPNFTDSFVYYVASFNPGPVIDSSWTVSGSRSFVSLGNNLTQLNFYIVPGATVDIDSLHTRTGTTITNDGELLFRKGTFDHNSMVQFVSADPQHIPAASYYNMTVTGSEKKLLGDVTVSGTLNMIGDVNGNGYTFRLSSLNSELNHLSGIVRGRFARPVGQTPLLFPVGIGNFYRPVTVTCLTGSQQFTISFADTFINNAGLPQFDATLGSLVRINKASRDGLWRVELPTSGASNAYTLAATATGFQGIADSSKLRLIKRNIGGTWTIQGTAQTVTGTAAAPEVSRTNLSGSGEFTLGSDSVINPLPVNLATFEAMRTPAGNYLAWSTASEINNKGFTVLRSFDGKNWEQVTFVKGNGTSSNVNRYTYTDPISCCPVYYYQLRQADYDGTTHYSEIKAVHQVSTGTMNISVYPNPLTSDRLYFSGLTEPASEIAIYDASGLKHRSITVTGAAELSAGIPVGDLARGVYYLEIRTASGTANCRFIK